MLVITRKPGEKICLGDDIVVTVLEVAGSTVRLGIDAPAEVAVYRHEVWVSVQEENRAAAETSVEELSTGTDTPQDS